jgi:hypothetical protein
MPSLALSRGIVSWPVLARFAARTTRRSSSSERTGRIAWEGLAPAMPAASIRSARPVNFKNGRKFDTTQNKEDVALWCAKTRCEALTRCFSDLVRLRAGTR